MTISPFTPGDRDELEAHRDGIGHLAEDPMHAGQPVWRLPDDLAGEPRYRIQVTHTDLPLWQCDHCRKLTLGNLPARCAGCGLDGDGLSPLLYGRAAACRSWGAEHGGGYDGDCQIVGWDGCICPEVTG